MYYFGRCAKNPNKEDEGSRHKLTSNEATRASAEAEVKDIDQQISDIDDELRDTE